MTENPTPRRTLGDVQARQRAFAEARRWQRFHTPKNLVMALTGEVGELTELFQWLTPEQAAAPGPELRDRIADEMADVLLYLARLADVLEVDLLAAADAKIDRNEGRFPVDAANAGLRRVPAE